MKGHICGRGCNGNIHAEVVSEPGRLDYSTLVRWLEVKELIVREVSGVFMNGSEKPYSIVVWKE